MIAMASVRSRASSTPLRRLLELAELRWRGPQLWIRANLEGHPFTTSIWYSDVDLDALEGRIGRDAMERLAFHVAAFEINKLASLAPTQLSFGAYARFVTPAFVALWKQVLVKVWGQWRWEHDLPAWTGPELVDVPRVRSFDPSELPARDAADVLLFFGGGKDSLVAARLLDAAGVRWSSHTYAHSVYGPPDPQHAIIDRLLDVLEPGPRARHKQWVADDAFAAPLPALMPAGGAKSFLAAETPSSIFGSLPIILTHGYRRMALAHEYSANRGNLIWSKTGEDINHQWGKSWEAEDLLSSYVDEHLVRGFRWFSILQPLSDVLIFELLRGAGDSVVHTHSCNLRKPWCFRCPKCAYVALGYAAHLPDGAYERVFAEDVLDLPENEIHFRQMIGLGEHTPFECIGEIDEARLALALCAARGRRSRAVQMFEREGGTLDLPAILARYATVHDDAPHGIPADLAAKVLGAMKQAEHDARQRIEGLLANVSAR
jgi:hypothetical protein